MEINRKPLSKRTRMEIFKRDLFTCQYCGARIPNVTLQIDHIIPVSKGGSNSSTNLITACFDCNMGKSNIPLDRIILPSNHAEDLARQVELREQMKAMEKFNIKVAKELEIDVDAVMDYWSKAMNNGKKVADRNREGIRHFIKCLGRTKAIEASSKALCRIDDYNNAYKYFCGICHNMIKDSKGNRQ
jgi:hypothetical protein